MENKVDYLQKTVSDTDRRIENLSFRVEKWERAMSELSLDEPEEETSVFDLLHDVTQVREDYEQLRSDITEIQQLQKEVSASLRSQINVMHAKYGFLRSKLGPALPSCLMMSTNSYQPSPTNNGGIDPRTRSQ